MGQFWVVGGEHTETLFHEALNGAEEWIGPFPDYQAAKKEWSRHAWQTVDHSEVRYRIERIDLDQPPACTD